MGGFRIPIGTFLPAFDWRLGDFTNGVRIPEDCDGLNTGRVGLGFGKPTVGLANPFPEFTGTGVSGGTAGVIVVVVVFVFVTGAKDDDDDPP